MSLKDFKIKHKREIVNGGDTIIIPRCANERTDEERQKTPNEIALHIASADPIAVNASDIPADTIARERRIAEEQVAQEGKPEAIRAKIVEGKVKKFASERALIEQPFVKDESMTIGQMVSKVPGAAVSRFARFKVGEV